MNNTITQYKINYTPDDFACGACVTDANRIIIYVNSYFTNELQWQPEVLLGKNVDTVFTKSSKIFFQSYLIPTLLHEKKCEEMQLLIMNGKGERLPVTVNAHIGSDHCIYWSFFNASKRDLLYEELLKTRSVLEAQAEQLKQLAATDELTQLLNRREMKVRSTLMLEQAARSHQIVSLLMLDIDFFKIINDTYGHMKGDDILKELGAKLNSECRKTDLVARIGGEEFLIMLPDINQENTLLFCQKLHALVATIKVENTPITISIGVSIADEKMSFAALYAQADKAVYQAKEQGRNRTEFFQAVK